jgi:glycosyltransferase involved in cell wall biosynthesis
MKALINIGHGEGYGLPLFEAAYNGLPLITTTWSGQLDFITKPNKKGKNVPRVAAVDYDIKPVQKEAVWPGVVQEDSMWAFARESSYKRVLGEVLEKEVHYTKEAETLKNHILENFTEEKIYSEFVDAIYNPTEEEAEWAEALDQIKIL